MLLDPSWGVPGVLPARPPTWDAFREFHQGDLSFYVDGVDSAFAHFSRAGARDPTFALARLRAAQVLINAGTRRWGPADSALTAVAADRTTMSPFERGYLDCIEAWHRGNWEGAYTATVTLTEIAPRSEFAGYLRGTFANLTRRWHKAVSVLERLDPLASDLRARSAYYGHLSNAHHMLGEHSRELATARRRASDSPIRSGSARSRYARWPRWGAARRSISACRRPWRSRPETALGDRPAGSCWSKRGKLVPTGIRLSRTPRSRSC